ncbi:MAG: alpha/beta hydrolase [Kofleriaceae bacterium]
MELRAFALAALATVACGDDVPATHDAAPGIDMRPMIDADEGAVPRAETVPCRYDVPAQLGLNEGSDYACGDLIVYEDREARVRTIKVHFVKFESASTSPNATIYLDGGPGGDGQNILYYAAFLGAPFLDGLRVDGDFLVISQRGTARSIPYLDCQDFACEDFANDYDLPSYNTAANADDVDDLRAVLGYTKLNLYGISYGSRLGLEVLRRHGGNVRSAVIEGLVPSSIAWPAAIPASFYSALTGLHASCAAAAPCGTTFGDLVMKFSAAVVSLNDAPLPMSIQGQPFDLDGYTFAYVVFRVMYSKSAYVWLPLAISDLAARRIDRVESYLAAALENLGGGSGISPGLYNSVVCGEIFNPPDPNAPVTLNAGVPSDIVEMFSGSWESLSERCEFWPRGNLQATLAQPVTSSVRSLVSSGRLDPITPPGFGDIAAATLSDSVVVIHENSGHGATLQSTCGLTNLTAFLADPAAPHDTNCAASIATTYILPSALVATPFSFIRMKAELRFAPPLPPSIGRRLAR